MSRIYESSISPLQQLTLMLEQLPAEAYTQRLPILFESSIGMHVRHILEFYSCLLKGLAEAKVNYDARPRDLILETDIHYAHTFIHHTCNELKLISGNPSLCLIVSMDQTEFVTKIESNLYRELTYVMEHAIHHMAIMKVACQIYFPSANLHPHFGMAYSTIKHKELCAP